MPKRFPTLRCALEKVRDNRIDMINSYRDEHNVVYCTTTKAQIHTCMFVTSNKMPPTAINDSAGKSKVDSAVCMFLRKRERERDW